MVGIAKPLHHPRGSGSGSSSGVGGGETVSLKRTVVCAVLMMLSVTLVYYLKLSGHMDAWADSQLNTMPASSHKDSSLDAPDATEIVEQVVTQQVVEIERAGDNTGGGGGDGGSGREDLGQTEGSGDDKPPAAMSGSKPSHSNNNKQYSRSYGGNKNNNIVKPIVHSPKSGMRFPMNNAASKGGWTDEKPGPPFLNASVKLKTRKELEDPEGDLEFIKNSKPLFFYLRNKTELNEKWLNVAKERKTTTKSVVKMACLFAGFVRDYENMFRGCLDSKDTWFCARAKLRKFYGNQREYLLDSTDCDVYISTWDIRGAGRYSTTKYDMSQAVKGDYVKYYYRHRAAGVHVQKYSEYQDVWRYMHKFMRNFPQMRPTSAKIDGKPGEESWSGKHESNELLRMNDYSQSYKHWAVVNLALKSGFKYDLFYRLRCDLRMTSKLSNFQFDKQDPDRINFDILQVEVETVECKGRKCSMKKKPQGAPVANGNGGKDALPAALLPPDEDEKKDDDADGAKKETVRIGTDDDDDKVTEVNITRKHYVSKNRIHTSNFDIADFGFMGTPQMIAKLTHVWWYCLVNSTEWVPSVAGKPISEYNLMVWRIIFDAKWEVDSGGRYLWVSRRHGQNMKSGGTTVVIKKIIIKKKPKSKKH